MNQILLRELLKELKNLALICIKYDLHYQYLEVKELEREFQKYQL